jgi:hypothetical protein
MLNLKGLSHELKLLKYMVGFMHLNRGRGNFLKVLGAPKIFLRRKCIIASLRWLNNVSCMEVP